MQICLLYLYNFSNEEMDQSRLNVLFFKSCEKDKDLMSYRIIQMILKYKQPYNIKEKQSY
jgi:hypothetical protein